MPPAHCPLPPAHRLFLNLWQRLLALRAAINELEGRRSRPQPAVTLPPIDAADAAGAPALGAPSVGEEPSVPAPPTFFVTSDVPKITTVQVREGAAQGEGHG